MSIWDRQRNVREFLVLGLRDALERVGVGTTHDVFVCIESYDMLVFAPPAMIMVVAGLLAREQPSNTRVLQRDHPDRAAIEAAFMLGGLAAVDLIW